MQYAARRLGLYLHHPAPRRIAGVARGRGLAGEAPPAPHGKGRARGDRGRLPGEDAGQIQRELHLLRAQGVVSAGAADVGGHRAGRVREKGVGPDQDDRLSERELAGTMQGPPQNFSRFDLVAWTRQQLWERQVPATVLPAPTGGVLLYLESGQQIVLPDGQAVGYFLAGWEANERSAEATAP